MMNKSSAAPAEDLGKTTVVTAAPHIGLVLNQASEYPLSAFVSCFRRSDLGELLL